MDTTQLISSFGAWMTADIGSDTIESLNEFNCDVDVFMYNMVSKGNQMLYMYGRSPPNMTVSIKILNKNGEILACKFFNFFKNTFSGKTRVGSYWETVRDGTKSYPKDS